MIWSTWCCIFLILQVTITLATWQCDCEPKFEDPPDMSKLRRAMAVDPLAEWKYHFDCVTVQEPGSPSASADLRPCEPDSDKSLFISRVEEIKFGANIVRNRDGRSVTSSTLDFQSTGRYNATILDPGTNRCYAVPDAFVSTKHQPAVGVTFSRYASRGFRPIAATGRKDFLQKIAQSVKVEFGLDEVEFGNSSMKAAFKWSGGSFSRSDWKGQDGAESAYIETMLQVFVQTPVPTAEVIRQWINLANANTTGQDLDDAFRRYFEAYGTHYVESAAFGGRMTARFSAEKAPAPSDAQKRANCIATKLSQPYGFKVVGSSCRAAYPPTVDNGSVFDLLGILATSCDGGNGQDTCPGGSTEAEMLDSFIKWRESIKSNPIILRGQKQWITQLVERVAKGAMDGEEIYKQVVTEFGRRFDVWEFDGTVDFAKHLKRFQGFKELLSKYLVKYLEENDFCWRRINTGC